MKYIDELRAKKAQIEAEIEELEKPLTPESAAEQMLSFHDNHTDLDTQSAHVYADELLVRILRQHGYGKAADVFESMTKWYG